MTDTQPPPASPQPPPSSASAGSAPPPDSSWSSGTVPPADPQGSSSTQGFFASIRNMGVRRDSDRWIAGVCAGIARHFKVDPLIIRAAAVALLLLGIGFLAYLIAWALLPDQDDSIVAEKAIRDGDAWGVTMLVVIGVVLFGTGPFVASGRNWWGLFVLAAMIALVWWLVTKSSGPKNSTPPTSAAAHTGPAQSAQTAPTAPTPPAAQPAPWPTAGMPPAGYEARVNDAPHSGAPYAGAPYPGAAYSGTAGRTSSASYSAPQADPGLHTERRPRAKGAGFAGFLLVLAAAVIAWGIGLMAAQRLSTSNLLALVAATGAAGLATLVLGIFRRRSVLGSLLSLALAASLVASWGVTTVPNGGGTTTWQPVATSTTNGYHWNMGSATLDLRGISERPDQRDITASVNLGELVVYVPEGITTRVVASTQFGSVQIDGVEDASIREDQGGATVIQDVTFGPGSEPDLTVHASARFGAIRIITTTDPN